MKRFVLSLIILFPVSFYAMDDVSIICINGLTVTLEPDEFGDCSSIIYAEDLIVAAPPGPLEFAIYNAWVVAEAGDDFIPEFTATSATQVICGMSDATHIVNVYVRDVDQNIHYCETYLLVQSLIGCPFPDPYDEGALSGQIKTESGDSISDVKVSYLGFGNIADSTFTSISGQYHFDDLFCNEYFAIAPGMDINPINGVTVMDLIIISRHILGIELLDSPYKLLAADVNNSMTITAMDLIAIQRLILGLDMEFSNNPSWRFINADHVFLDPDNPWFGGPLPEVIHDRLPHQSPDSFDFIGIKIGDVNGSAVTQ